jgi:hypothetical protein
MPPAVLELLTGRASTEINARITVANRARKGAGSCICRGVVRARLGRLRDYKRNLMVNFVNERLGNELDREQTQEARMKPRKVVE